MSIIIAILFLTLLNAFFSMSEMAIIASKKPILKEMLKKGNKNVENVLKILENQGRFLSSIQVGITLIGTLTAVYGGANISKNFGDFLNSFFAIDFGQTVALVVVVVILTYISVVVGELVPKKIALRNPEIISVFVAKTMLSFANIFSPIVKSFDFCTEIIMKSFGIFGKKNENEDKEAQLKAMINESAESGAIEKSEYEMMQRIFKLDNRDAKSIMTHISDITFIKIDDDIEDIKRKLNEAQHSRYPVISDDSQKVLGIVHTKELFASYISLGKIDVKNHLKPVHFISENVNCLKVLEMFKSSSITLAVVLDEYGATEGIVSASDIFEAIVGLIPANYDEGDEVMIIDRKNGSWLVDGVAPIDEINLVIGIEEINEGEKYDTIAGFVVDNIEDVKEGCKFEKYGYSFEIVDMDGLKIDKILISKIQIQ